MEEGRQKGIKYSLKCSYLEVYNEELTDLLCKGGQHSKHKPLVRYLLTNISRVKLEVEKKNKCIKIYD